MKKLTYLLSALLIASIGLVGCDNKDDNEAPTITNLKVNGTAISDGFSALAGEVTITFDASDDSKVAKVSVTESGAAAPVFSKDKVDKTPYAVSFKYTVSKTVNLIATVTDDDDKSISITIAVKLDAGVSSYSAKLLGAQTNATEGSFLKTSDGTIYLQADAKTNAAAIDILYFYGATNLATLAAPSDTDAGSIFDNATTGLQTWTVKNPTSFKVTTLTQTNFNEVRTAGGAEAAYTGAAGTAASKANNLTSGKVVAFKTAAGKYGLAYVSALTTGATGSITLDVKVGK